MKLKFQKIDINKVLGSKFMQFGISTLLILGIIVGGLNSHSMDAYAEEVIAENYYSFTPGRYAEAQGAADAIVLNFYADWCVTCTEMEPALIDVMSEVGLNENIYAFRVNFGDDSEISEGRELADKFGIKTQSTYVVLKKDDERFKTFFNSVSREELKQTLVTAANF